jgi:dTDP-4-dehydrorhamnose reductase
MRPAANPWVRSGFNLWMRILLLGAGGQLARDLAQTLAHHTVIPRSHAELDIRDKEAITRVCGETQPGCIINTAAYHRVDDCEDHPELAFAVNAGGVYNVAQAAQRHKAVLVHFSTDYVFDGAKSSPYTEADRPNPHSVYGISKWAGEKLTAAYCERHFIIRTCGLYGAGGSKSKGGNFVRSILHAAQQNKPLRVVTNQIVTPTCTSDLAEKVSALIDQEAYGIYHMTNTGECSWFEFATEVLRLSSLAADITPVTGQEYGAKAARPAYSVLDNMRMRALGIEEFRPWQHALADFIAREQRELRSAA